MNENLIPLNKRTKDKQKEIAQMGGIASGVARRRKKQTSELLSAMINSPITNEKVRNTVSKLAGDLEDDDLTVNALMAAGLIKSAASGNVKAFETIQNYVSIQEEKDSMRWQIPITDITTDYVELYRLIWEVWKNERNDIREIILKGGRGSIKSNFISAIAEELIYNDENAHCVFTRRYKTDLRGSVYNQFMKTVIRHGNLDKWEFKTNPMCAIYKKTGQQVIFVGADKPISLKSYNMTFGSVKLLVNEEADEMAGIEQMDNIEDTFLRGDTPALSVKIFNPPKSINNFMNAYVEEKKNDKATYIHHSYYYNVPKKWLGQRFFDRADWFKEHKPKYYANNYLGEVTGTGGAIFENIEERKITDTEIEAMPYFYYGLDFGYEHPQAFEICYYDAETATLYCVGEEYARRCKNSTFARKIAKYKKYEIIADSARPDNIEELNDWGFDVIGAKKRWGGGKGRDYCWEWLRMCNKIVIDSERCPHLYKELSTLEFEQLKDGTFSSEYPKLDEDCIMALIYGLNRVIMETRRLDAYADEDIEGEEEYELDD